MVTIAAKAAPYVALMIRLIHGPNTEGEPANKKPIQTTITPAK